jgi:hypothetical protein
MVRAQPVMASVSVAVVSGALVAASAARGVAGITPTRWDVTGKLRRTPKTPPRRAFRYPGRGSGAPHAWGGRIGAMRGPYGIVGVIVTILVIYVLLRLLGVV